MAKILEVKDLCKTYIVNKRQKNVLKNVNFTVGEVSGGQLQRACKGNQKPLFRAFHLGRGYAPGKH